MQTIRLDIDTPGFYKGWNQDEGGRVHLAYS